MWGNEFQINPVFEELFKICITQSGALAGDFVTINL